MSELIAGWRVWPSYFPSGLIARWNAQRRRGDRWPAYDYVSRATRNELVAILMPKPVGDPNA